MKKVVLFVFLLTQFSLLGMAQSSGASTTSEPHGTAEGYFGYTHVTGDIGQNGWDLSGAKVFGEHFAGEAEFTGSYGNTSVLNFNAKQHQYAFLFGPKVMFDTKDSRITPFAHLLFGVAHTGLDTNIPGANDADTAFAWALGGGVDYNITHNVAARGKVDLYHTDYFSSGDTHARWGFGLVYKFGR